jgi:hypothetical protein
MKKMKFSSPKTVSHSGEHHSDGMVWQGDLPMTRQDELDVYAMLRRDDDPHAHTMYSGDSDEQMDALIQFDPASIVGRYDPEYSTYYFRHKGGTKYGGIGSEIYERQNIGKGVKFTKKKIWIHGQGTMAKMIPPNHGAYHVDSLQRAIAGPEPLSLADELLGDGHYQWDTENQWWIVVKGPRPHGKVKHGKAEEDKAR